MHGWDFNKEQSNNNNNTKKKGKILGQEAVQDNHYLELSAAQMAYS